MRILLILPALLLASCGSQRNESQHAKVDPIAASQPEPEAKVATTVAFTEGPAQGPDGLIYFTDITNNRILRSDPKARKHEVFRADSNRSNGLLFDAEGRLIACESSDPERNAPRLTRTDMKTGKLQVLASGPEGKQFKARTMSRLTPSPSVFHGPGSRQRVAGARQSEERDGNSGRI